MDISWDDAIVAIGTESGTIELYNQSKMISQAGTQLQELTKQIQTGVVQDHDESKSSPALLKHYYTKTNQGGILKVQFSWMNFLYTVGCVEKNFF
jgi:hypothetical protein